MNCFGNKFKSNSFIRFRPEEHDITCVTHLFKHGSELPQTVIDKIINAYDQNEKTFKEVEVSIHEFNVYNKAHINVDNDIQTLKKHNTV